MLDLYTPSVQRVVAEQAKHGLPMIVWLAKDGQPPEGNEQRVIAANLARIFGGCLLVDQDAA